MQTAFFRIFSIFYYHSHVNTSHAQNTSLIMDKTFEISLADWKIDIGIGGISLIFGENMAIFENTHHVF